MKKHLLSAISFLALGFLMMSGVRLAEYTFDRPPLMLMICIAEEEGITGHCTPFEEYLPDER